MSVLQMTVLLLFILITTFYLLFPKKEGFLNVSGVTSSSIYKDAGVTITPSDIDSQYNAMRSGLADKGNLLHMKRCYQFPNETIESIRNKFNYMLDNDGMYYTDFDMVTCKFSDVESRIMCELQKFKDQLCGSGASSMKCGTKRTEMDWSSTKGCPSNIMPTTTDGGCNTVVHGPVYALVFQAPYYRVKDDITKEPRPLTLQFQTLDVQLMPRNGYQNDDDSGTPLFIYVQLLFSKYNKNGTYTPGVDYMNQYFIPVWDRKYFSKEMQCFIKTVGKNDMVGGCATIDKPYEAKCLGPKDAMVKNPKDEKNTPSSYGILYTVNQDFTLLSNIFQEDSIISKAFVYPQVYFKKGPFGNKEDAAMACAQENGVLASVNDIQDAYFAGANICQNGYASNGSIVQTSQGTLPECREKGFKTMFKKNVNDSKVGAFCYGIRPAQGGTDDKGITSWNAKGYETKFDWTNNKTNQIKQVCGTFSEEKYFAKYPDAKNFSPEGGLWHWAHIGIQKGYDGFIREGDMSGKFDEDGYAIVHIDKPSTLSSLDHLKQVGWQENRRVCLKTA